MDENAIVGRTFPMMRVRCRLSFDARTMDDGETKIRRGRDETFISDDVAYREGAFFE